MEKKIFRRTDLGNEELRLRSLNLSKVGQLVLLTIDGDVDEDSLAQRFPSNELHELTAALDDLQRKKLIERTSKAPDVVKSSLGDSAQPNETPEDFFSSSLNPFQGGSGLVVDTKTNSMRSMRHRKKRVDSEIDVDFYVRLDGVGSEVEDKRQARLQKLVEVYPNPVQKKKRKKKRSLPPPESKWVLRIYIALISGGIIAVIAAIAFSR